jgi:hypothetical protein
MLIGAQASCLWGNRASRLVDTFPPAGKMPIGPTAKMAVLLQSAATLSGALALR